MSDESIKNNSEQNTPKAAENTENEDFVDINSSSEDEVVFHGTIRETQNTVPKKVKASKKRIVTNTVCIVLACIMIIAGSGFIVVFSIFSRVGYAPINNTEDEIKSSSQVSKQNSQINNHTYEGKLLNDQQILNILLIGADTRYNATSGNSDTMILLSIDTKNKKIKLLSLLRDTYIAIPGYEGNKLNAPFAFSGAELTVKTIQLNYGIQIDRYAIVDFYSFKEIIDSIGGLDIDLTEEEIDYINWQIWINEQPEYSELPAGEYTVTYYLGLEEGTEIPEDGILGTVGVNSNAGAFNSADYQKKIDAGELTPVIENLIVESDCEDFELQVYAACAGLRIDSIEIRRN